MNVIRIKRDYDNVILQNVKQEKSVKYLDVKEKINQKHYELYAIDLENQ